MVEYSLGKGEVADSNSALGPIERNKMKTIFLTGLFLIFFGCSLNKNFVKSVKVYTDVILPEYKVYINNDTTLREDSKKIRIRTAEKFEGLINDALRESER